VIPRSLYPPSCPPLSIFLWLWLVVDSLVCVAHAGETESRRPTSDADLKYWLRNMVWHHRFSPQEIQAATGLTELEIQQACRRFKISETTRPRRSAKESLTVLPYPGGRHPRIGFLEGAVDPQRETKVSVFTPWDDTSYVVCDFPEAIWSNLGLTYLAHTHVPTLWSKSGTQLPKREWERRPNKTLVTTRTLPNGIRFGTEVRPGRDGVHFSLWLFNGTRSNLTDLRVQNCVMLKAATGFNAQSNTNKVFSPPFVACRSESADRWIISGWEPCHRPWANAPVPCIHADPKFPDCAPGQTQRLSGWLSFYEGHNIEAEMNRLKTTMNRTR